MTYEELYRNCDCEEELNHKVKFDIKSISDLPLEEKSKKLRAIIDASKKVADERNWFLEPIVIGRQKSKESRVVDKLKQKLIKDFQEEHAKRDSIESELKKMGRCRDCRKRHYRVEFIKHDERMIYIQNLIDFIENNEEVNL